MPRVPVEDGVGEAGVIGLAFRGDGRALREERLDQSLAFQRRPGRRVGETGGVAAGHDRVAQMEMVAMRRGNAADDHGAVVVPPHDVPLDPRQRLQQGERLQLERVQIQRVALEGHSGLIVWCFRILELSRGNNPRSESEDLTSEQKKNIM